MRGISTWCFRFQGGGWPPGGSGFFLEGVGQAELELDLQARPWSPEGRALCVSESAIVWQQDA